MPPVVVQAPDAAAALPRACTPDLRLQYEAYCRRQARGLIRLLPREAVRPLYRRALRSGYAELGGSDPLTALAEYCGSLLPLPPFDTWLHDVSSHKEAHLHDLDDSAEAPTAQAPATLETKPFELNGRPWTAHLRAFREGSVWRGFIAFEGTAVGEVHRTTLIFREAGPVEIRERFVTFEDGALEAFLRSALP